MKKIDLKKLALLGITGGLILTSQPASADISTNEKVSLENLYASMGCGAHCSGSSAPTTKPGINPRNLTADNEVDVKIDLPGRQKAMTQDELLLQLDDNTKKTFNSLDNEGKTLALTLANQTCKGQNDCAGLNSCKTASNSCAGNGSCKGTSPGPFKDKNQAVQVAAKKMAEKRHGA